MAQPRIGVVLATTREGRFGPRPAEWVTEIARGRGDMDVRLFDLRDFPLPFFSAPQPPAAEPPKGEVAERWSGEMAACDGYVFVTAEYNHSVPGVLKNALDHLYREVNRKPAAFVGYGGTGGARSVEHLRLICVELQMAPLRGSVHIGATDFRALRQGEDFASLPHLGKSAERMLDELFWWTEALRAARTSADR